MGDMSHAQGGIGLRGLCRDVSRRLAAVLRQVGGIGLQGQCRDVLRRLSGASQPGETTRRRPAS